MTIVYQDGPYARQEDYLVPPPHRLRGMGGDGYYQRTARLDAHGRLVYEWVGSASGDLATGSAYDSTGSALA